MVRRYVNELKTALLLGVLSALVVFVGSLFGRTGLIVAVLVAFGVNGYDIVTDAATVFTPACSGLKSGNKVTVRGIVQPGGSIKATSVVKQ